MCCGVLTDSPTRFAHYVAPIAEVPAALPLGTEAAEFRDAWDGTASDPLALLDRLTDLCDSRCARRAAVRPPVRPARR